MIHYNENEGIVLDTLHRYGYGARAVSTHEECFKKLKRYLEESGITQFSQGVVQDFLKTAGSSFRAAFTTSIGRLSDVYQYGYVLRSHLKFHTSCLSPEFRKVIDLYVTFTAQSRSDVHVRNIRHSCEHFCSFVQLSGGASLDDISYLLLEKYDLEGRKSTTAFSIKEGLVEGVLFYWANKGIVPYGYGLFMYYIQSSRVIKSPALPEDTQEELKLYGDGKQYGPANGDFGDVKGFLTLLEEAGYGESMLATAKNGLNLLFLFLDMHNLGYQWPIMGSDLKWGVSGDSLCFSGNEA